MKRLVKGIEKMRRVRRKPLPPIATLSDEDGPPGLHPSSDEYCPASDELDPEIEKLEVRSGRTRRRRRAIRRSDAGGDSSQESGTGNASPNAQNHRTAFSPSLIEETATAVCGIAFDSCNGIDHHPPIGSVGRLLSSTNDGSCRSTHRPRKRHPLQAETRNQCGGALNGISMLQEVRRSGTSAVQNPDGWVLIHRRHC